MKKQMATLKIPMLETCAKCPLFRNIHGEGRKCMGIVGEILFPRGAICVCVVNSLGCHK